jgi:hypothetical protein
LSHVRLEIELDETSERVVILLDDRFRMTAVQDRDGQILFRNFDQVIDDPLHTALKQTATSLLRLLQPA